MDPSVTCIPRDSFKDHPLLARLLELHNVPEKINILGTLPKVTLDEYGRATPRILTIVGSRKNTTYGRQALEMLITSLKGEDVVIISGLALGIDGLAHRSALSNNLKTVSIPGSGLSEKVLYPSSHKSLAKEILSSDGALISELPHDTKAAPWTFPMRNRIMAALSDAVLFIEAEEKSGTLITARQALELGRDIGAVPGDIFSQTAFGTNMLIREGAYAITSPENLFDLLHLSQKDSDQEKGLTIKNYSTDEAIIMEILREPMDKDTLFNQTGLSFEDFISAFSSLELEGYLQETFGEVRRLV
jgi:DNA processing protein